MTGNSFHAALFIALSAAASLFAQAPITLLVVDPPGLGFNDPTPAAPVGGNKGVTIGEQRLIVFKYAAAIWSSKLASPVPIRVRSSYGPLPCTAKNGTLGATVTPEWFVHDAPHPEFIRNVWYPAALANRISETVLDPDMEEIVVTFNPDLDQPDCLPNVQWYYGLDNRATSSQADMLATVLHELAHGFGFGPLSEGGFSKFKDRGDVFSQYALDTTTGKNWNEMTNQERAVSALNTRLVVWNGINVVQDVPKVLRPGSPKLRITEPPSLAGDYYVATALFGQPLSTAGLEGQVALALDEANADGPSKTDACSPIINISEISGRIAVADRGTCSFVQKARNVQAAGAIGLIAVNNVDGNAPTYITGTDPTIRIPVVHLMLSDGNTLKVVLADFQKVTANLLADPELRAGADRAGRPILFNPVPSLPGSSMSHWDPMAAPNQLMEPDIAVDLSQGVEPPNDLTLSLLKDLGWFSDFDGVPDGVDQCPGSDRRATVFIQGCDTHVPNTTSTTGCRVSDYFKACEGLDPGSRELAACLVSISKPLTRSGMVAPRQLSGILACAARSPSQ
jgi:hypothetical protein